MKFACKIVLSDLTQKIDFSETNHERLPSQAAMAPSSSGDRGGSSPAYLKKRKMPLAAAAAAADARR